jgi:hypothetical protein
MKKKIIIVLAFLLALPVAAMAGKVKNDLIGFSFKTPRGWTITEQRMPGAETIGHTAAQSTVSRPVPMTKGDLKDWGVGIAQDTAISAVGYGVTKSVMKGLPKFATYQLRSIMYPEASLTLMAAEMAAMPPAQEMPQQGEEVEVQDKKGKVKKVKRECKTVWKEDRKWGSEPGTVFVTRCSHGEGKWLYTAMANTDRKGISYILSGSMTSKNADDSDFNTHMKPAMKKIMDSFKFKK